MSSDSSKSEEDEPIINQPEDFPEKKKFNTDAPGQKNFEQQDDINTYRNPTKTEDTDDKKSKDDNHPEQNQGHSGQNAQKLGSTSSKEEDMEKEWIFLDFVPNSMKCKICYHILESPQLISCCYTNICKKCMARHLQRCALLNQQPSCPFCRSTEFELVNNKALEDSINQLRVKCCYQHKGCGWTGTLQNGKLHLKECDFMLIDCPNGCGYEQFERYKFSDHMRICPHTRTTCSFGTIGCDMRPHVRSEAQKHANDCLSEHLLLLARKNTELLKDFRHHCTLLSSEACKPKLSNGEHAKSQREASSSIQHTIATLKESLQDIKKRTSSLKAELRKEEICLEKIKKKITKTKEVEAAYKETVADLQTYPVPEATGLSYPPVTFTIDNFKNRIKLKDNNMWLSPPFYTHVGGYKMCLSVHPAGSRRSGYESYISVYIHFLVGEFDEHLIWPFPGAVFTITAINQRADKCNISVNLELDGRDALVIRSQQTDQYLSFEFGTWDFLSHSNLSSFLTRDNCFKLMLYRIQFLK